MMDKDKNAQRESTSLRLFLVPPNAHPPPFLSRSVSFEEFQEGSKADPTIISALTLVSRSRREERREKHGR